MLLSNSSYSFFLFLILRKLSSTLFPYTTLFRSRIEYWIEGDRGKQMRLDRQKWDAEKIRKKGLKWFIFAVISRSEEHTSELQSRGHLVCRLLLEKKKTNK